MESECSAAKKETGSAIFSLKLPAQSYYLADARIIVIASFRRRRLRLNTLPSPANDIIADRMTNLWPSRHEFGPTIRLGILAERFARHLMPLVDPMPHLRDGQILKRFHGFQMTGEI